MKPPFFIIGNPRSGTTLLRLMLNNHRRLLVPPECGFVVWWHDKYQDWSPASCGGSGLDSFVADLATSRKLETWRLDLGALREFLGAEHPRSYAQLASCVYVFFGRSVGRAFTRWGDKNNFHIKWIDLLAGLYPQATFIHIVRDGRDVACSYRRLAALKLSSEYAPRLPSVVTEIAREWRSNLETVATSFEKLQPHRVLELRYEDLVRAPRNELRRICRFLGEPFDDAMMEYDVRNRQTQEEPREFLAWKEKTLEPPTESEVGKYSHEMSAEELAEFEDVAGSCLARYGYVPAG